MEVRRVMLWLCTRLKLNVCYVASFDDCVLGLGYPVSNLFLSRPQSFLSPAEPYAARCLCGLSLPGAFTAWILSDFVAHQCKDSWERWPRCCRYGLDLHPTRISQAARYSPGPD
jgi:hypothetical protein